ncbi:N-terminal acetyltransferase [Podila humilis]|nr:N-terminal acetyltransferase [Podila humilis]
MTIPVPVEEHYTTEQILAILHRIQYPLKNTNELPPPTLETLRELNYRCVTSIPFDTLALRVTKTRAVDISLEGIYDWVVNKKRGGWCFSINRLAYELLYAIGYKVQCTLGRVCKPLNPQDPIRYGGLTHRVNLVRLEDGSKEVDEHGNKIESKYVFDIGFGVSSFYPLKLEEGGAGVEFFGHRRRLTKVTHDEQTPEILGTPTVEYWRVEEFMGLEEDGTTEKWTPDYAFNETQYYEADTVVGNFYCNYSSSAPFLHSLWVIQGTLDGHFHILINKEFKIRSATGDVLKIEIETEQQRLDILKKYFGIELTEEEFALHDKKIEST